MPPAPPEGKLRFIIVGEAPGRLEVLKQGPFLGPSGALLNRVLKEAGLRREEAWVTNAIACRPEDDRPDVKLAATSCCAPRLARELESLPPKTPVLALGQWGARAILGTRSILKSRGFVWDTPDVDPAKVTASERALVRMRISAKKEGKEKARATHLLKKQHSILLLKAHATYAGRKVIPSVHPAFILRGADGWFPILINDMRRFKKLLDGKLVLEDEAPYTLASTPREIERAIRALGEIHPGKNDISLDIETTGKDAVRTEMKCLAMSDGEKTVVIHPWEDSLVPALKRALSKRVLVMHNGPQFDHIVLRRKGLVIDKWEDTLIAHHAFAGHLPKSLAHVVSVFCDSRPWKQLAGKQAGSEKGIAPWEAAERAGTEEKRQEAISNLLRYNGADARLTALAWQRMDADLETELHIYESDKVMALLCQSMTEVGIGSDEAKREEISLGLMHRKRSLLGKMRVLVGSKTFHPARLNDVRWAIFGKFRAPLLRPTATGLAGTSNETLEYLKGRNPDSRAGVLADYILRWREAQKIKGTYIDGEHQAGEDGRVHAPWKLGPVTGRLAGPLMTLPKYKKDVALQVRAMYVAQASLVPRLVAQIHDAAIIEAFGQLFYYDLSQAEARLAAYFSGDENLIAACEADIHTENAKVVFADSPEAMEALNRANDLSPLLDKKGKPLKWKAVDVVDKGCKDYRDIAKSCGFAVWYCGSAERVFITLRGDGKPATMAMCEELVRRFHHRYQRYYQYVQENVDYVHRHGHLRTTFLGRIRWLGWHAPETEISNFPIQSGIADLQNERLPRIVQALPACKEPKDVEKLIRETWAEPILVPHNGKSFVMPVEVKSGTNWGESFG